MDLSQKAKLSGRILAIILSERNRMECYISHNSGFFLSILFVICKNVLANSFEREWSSIQS